LLELGNLPQQREALIKFVINRSIYYYIVEKNFQEDSEYSLRKLSEA